MKDNIIGPVKLDDWYWMRQLRESIKDAKGIDPVKYKIMIDGFSNAYKKELERTVSK